MQTQNPKSRLHVHGLKLNITVTQNPKSALHVHGLKLNTTVTQNSKSALHVHGLKLNITVTQNLKSALHVHGLKLSDPEPQKLAARVSSKTRYAKNPKMKIGHSKNVMQRTKKAFVQKEKTNIHCVSKSKKN